MDEIRGYRGKGTELISVYIPFGKLVSDVMAYLRNEESAASNIKSKTTMKNVTGAIESVAARLKTFDKIPENGIVIFCGEVPRAGDQTKMVQYVINPPEAITAFLYRCDAQFFTEPLDGMLVDKRYYGLIVIDRKEATIGMLAGTRIKVLKHYDSLVPSKHHQGGQSSVRFERLIEIAAHEWDERCYEFRARKAGVGEIPAEVIIPAKRWGSFVPVCYKGFDDMKMELGGIIGEVVDDNTVLWMPYYFKDDESMLGMTAFAFNFYLGDRAAEYGGRTTGFGIFFAWNLDNVHDPNTVALMREFKTFEDPHDVMNPGHVTCGMSRFGVNLSHGIMSMMSTVMQMAKKLLPPNTTFADNIERFEYNRLEEEKEEDRKHVLGRGYE